MNKYLEAHEVKHCWKCINCRVYRIEKKFQCIEDNIKFGDSDVEVKCKQFKSESGTDYGTLFE